MNFYSYNIVVVQELQEQDFGRRLIFAEAMLRKVNEDVGICVLTSDEAHFHFYTYVSKQNFYYWAPTNPQELHIHNLRSERITLGSALYVSYDRALIFFFRITAML